MEVDVIRQLEEQMSVFGVQVLRYPAADQEGKDFDLGLRRALSLPYSKKTDTEWPKDLIEKDTLYFQKDMFEEHYISLELPEELSASGERGSLIIGPYLLEEREDVWQRVVEQNDFSIYQQQELKNYYNRVPFIPVGDWLESMVIQQAAYLFGGKEKVKVNRLEYFFGAKMRPQDVLVEEDSALSVKMIEERYQQEDMMLDAIRRGDLEKVIETTSYFENHGLYSRAEMTLRNVKNLMLSSNTLFRKAVQEADVHPVYIDQLSRDFARRIEECNFEFQLEEIGREMRRKYCLLVRNHSLKNYSSIVQEAINYINIHLKEELSLKILAQECNLNASYLSTRFKKETGKTVTDYINDKKIYGSLVYLATTDMPIQEVAEQVGIFDENYFSRLFKKYQGMTAKQYRNLMKAKA